MKNLLNIKFFIKIFLITFGILNISLIPKSVYAENIDSFISNIVINKDGSILVEERILYDFGNEDRHGIIREIPIIADNLDGKEYKLEIEIISVTDDENIPYQYQTYKDGNNEVIKIGDPDSTITGENPYNITYNLFGAITYFSDHDELFWNINGVDTLVPTDKTIANVSLYDKESSFMDILCYSGYEGSTSTNCNAEINESSAFISRDATLGPNENVSFVVSFPKGVVDYYEREEISTFWTDLMIILISIYVFFMNFIAPLFVILFWYLSGRDPKGSHTIVRMYDPPSDEKKHHLSPMEVGAIVDETINPRDISAELIRLAINKVIKLKETKEKSFIFTDRKIYFQRGEKFGLYENGNLKKYQRDLIEGLELDKNEQTELDEIKTSFPKTIKSLSTDLYEELTNQQYFKKNPEKTRGNYMLAGGLLFFLLAFGLGVTLMIFSRFMPKKTLKGVKAREHSLGLKQFLKSQDRQLEFQEKNHEFFEKLLPYAITFGVANIWADKFKDISEYKPEWFEGSESTAFTSAALVNRLNSDLDTIQSSYQATSTTSSGGFSSGFSGGSSGGGFGGGGTSSW